MGEAILYSNCHGTYIFGPSSKIVDKIVFKSDKETYEESKKLKEGLWLESEVKMAKKYSDRYNIVYLGFKESPLKGVSVRFDAKKFHIISDSLRKEAIFRDLRRGSIVLARKTVRESFHRDFLIIQTISAIEEIDRVANMLVKRLREWSEVYIPEFSRNVQDNEKFAELLVKKDRKALLQEIKLNEGSSMGQELSNKDIQPLKDLAADITNLYNLRKKQEAYLEKTMKELCPNITAIAGALIGAKLLSYSGSLEKLSESPSSKIQVLGAEKALFRHMKTGSKPPKHGILFQHRFISAAEKSKRGKVARILADKISIASKVDYFKGEFVGDRLRKEIEAKIK